MITKKGVLTLSIVLGFGVLFGQVDYDKVPQVTNTYVIENATIYQTADRVIPKGSILIEDGIIKAVGPTVNIPAHAELIKADSMFIYPAFIDGLSHTAIPKPEGGDERPKVKFPGKVSDKIAGITPGNTVRDVLKNTDKSVSEMQKVGFAVSHVVPRGRMMPGYGSVILLSQNEEKEIILKENNSFYAQFRPASGVSPATLIGVVAKWKEMYKNAELKMGYDSKYKLNSNGLSRPNISKSEAALIPVVKKEIPVYFKTGNHKTIARAIQLQKSLGFDMILSEVKQGFFSTKKLQANRHPVLVSLDLPKDERKPKKDDEKEDATMDEKKDESADSKKEEDQDPELAALKKRKEESLDRHLGQAASFEKAGIEFAFSMMDSKPKDFKKNISKLIEFGLSEKTALNALTINAARLLKIDKMTGSVENGKLANLFITDKPYFEEKSNIRYVFVEGEKIEYEKKKEKKKKKSSGEPVNITGKYSYEVDMFGNTQAGTMVITESDGEYKITVASEDEPNDIDEAYDIAVDGNLVTYSFDIEPQPGMNFTLGMDLDFSADSFEGTVTAGEMGSFPITGERIGNPKN